MAEYEHKPTPEMTVARESGPILVEHPTRRGADVDGAEHREELGAWWVQQKAKLSGDEPEADAVDLAAATQPSCEGRGEAEDRGVWDNIQGNTAASFSDLIDESALAAGDWFDRAKASEPPPFWRQALPIAGAIVASATLGGFASQMAVQLIDQLGAKAEFIIGTAIRAAIGAAENTIRTGADAIADRLRGDPHAAVRAYCRVQRRGLTTAGIAAREAFRVKRSGTLTDQCLTIEEMFMIQQSNKRLHMHIQSVVDREMLIGWAAMAAGDTTSQPPGADIEDIEQAGVLRLTITGRAGRAHSITDARIDGLNPALRGSLTGRRLGEVRPGRPAYDAHEASTATHARLAGSHGGFLRQKHGLDICLTTAPAAFTTTPAMWRAFREADVVPPHVPNPYAIEFSVFVDRTGQRSWIDDDLAWQQDRHVGADAGRWFLCHIRRPFDLLTDLNDARLPEVTT